MPIIEACIFDLDGVIVDTAKYHYQSWRSIANDLDFDFTWEENEQLKGVSRVDSLDIILKIGQKTLSQEEKSKYLIQKNDTYLEHISGMNESEILPGISAFLKDLKRRKIKVAIGSASKNARPILEKTGLSEYFQVIVDGNEVSKSKPDPEVFLKGAGLLDVAPRNCIVFEDSFSGVIAANNGGFHSIGIGDPQFLHNADFVVTSLENMDLDDVVAQLSQ